MGDNEPAVIKSMGMLTSMGKNYHLNINVLHCAKQNKTITPNVSYSLSKHTLHMALLSKEKDGKKEKPTEEGYNKGKASTKS